MFYIGLMSGTSMDAIDTALVHFNDDSTKLIKYEEFPIGPELRRGIRNLCVSSPLGEVSKYDTLLGNLFADAACAILKKSGLEPSMINAIGCHGQTILHLPDNDYPATMQIGDPNIIASKSGITTVSDFRRMDMAAGGQGAPLAPAFHEFLFRDFRTDRVVLNIGGIANITVLAADESSPVTGFDTGPGNGLLDDWNRLHNGTDMDENSAWASGGNPDKELLELFLADPYFRRQPPKSTGRDFFNLAWVQAMLLRRGEHLQPSDIMATLFRLTIGNIAEAIRRFAPKTMEIILCGGGARNRTLLNNLQNAFPDIHLGTTTEKGYNPDAIEAMTFAWLAKQRLECKPGNLPSATGARHPVLLGGVYRPSPVIGNTQT